MTRCLAELLSPKILTLFKNAWSAPLCAINTVKCSSWARSYLTYSKNLFIKCSTFCRLLNKSASVVPNRFYSSEIRYKY